MELKEAANRYYWGYITYTEFKAIVLEARRQWIISAREVRQMLMEAQTEMYWDGSWKPSPASDNNETVAPGFECPMCRESRMDYLIMDDDDNATCVTCGHVYNPINSRRILEATNAR